MTWQPIETAPSTKRVLLYIVVSAQEKELRFTDHIDVGYPYLTRGATHWQPLPPAPKAKT